MKRHIFTCFLACILFNLSYAQQNYYDVTAGNGYGLRLWSSDNYKIHMGNSSYYKYGPVQDYSIKMTMNNDSDRGWTWGVLNTVPVAALNTTGNLQIAGGLKAEGGYVITGAAQIGNSPWGSKYARFCHSSMTGTGEYALLQEKTGATFLNAASGEKIYFRINNANKMTLNSDGELGIGTDSPKEKLHVYGGNLSITNSSGGIKITPHATLPYSANINSGAVIGAERNSIIHFWTENPVTDGESTWHWNYLRCKGTQVFDENNKGRASYTTTIKLRDINQKLNVFINDDGTAKFSGKVTALEIEVKPDVWSDFVFEKNYNLPSLQEVSQYIAEHGHLSDVPSEKEVIEEGINLGEMNAILLQKIEELTLYTIEQQKLIEAQNERLRVLEERVGSINEE